ncbi:DUF2249 domain-containing protein [Halorubrum trueperi]|uniref:DUF2249 domain-containing protein n=1 Tax=Halorubrum trueperi TaxID=2004704 RepID=A0ABD5URH1_9EURY
MNADRPDAERQLDVREIDGEPFGDIMDAIADLPADESLLLINSFEPEPLYGVLEARGFRYETTAGDRDGADRSNDPGVWYVEIRRK